MSAAADDTLRAPGPGWSYDILFQLGLWAWPVHACVIALTYLLLSELKPGVDMTLWLVAMTTVSLFQFALALAYLRRLPPPDRARLFGQIHLFLTGLAALGWGGGALALWQGTDTALVYYSLILGATALAAVGTQLTRPTNCLVSIWLSLALLSLAHALQGSRAGLAMAAMVLLFALALSVAAHLLERFLEQRVALIEQLGAQNQQLRVLAGDLSEAQAVRLRFLAQASHDIRQPIHAISLFVECLKGAPISGDDRSMLGQIERSVKGLALLCRSLLDLSALDVGRIRLVPADLRLQDIIDDVLRQAAETAREQDVRLRSVRSSLWVHADPAILHNMLQNLVSNAVKYAPGGAVLVGARRVGDRVAIDVIDTGVGIRKGDQGRVFTEFVRLPDRSPEPREGLGLGLTIVQRLAELTGLTLGLRSWPGRGSRFRIGGLRPVPARTGVSAGPAERFSRQLAGMRVLVIDDDPAVLLATSRLLARWGCIVIPLEWLPDVASHAPGRDFDLLLCDENSGQRSGLAFIADLRDHWGAPVPAIVVTGQDAERLRGSPLAGGVSVLSKPLSPARLRTLLQTLHLRAGASDDRADPPVVRPARDPQQH